MGEGTGQRNGVGWSGGRLGTSGPQKVTRAGRAPVSQPSGLALTATYTRPSRAGRDPICRHRILSVLSSRWPSPLKPRPPAAPSRSATPAHPPLPHPTRARSWSRPKSGGYNQCGQIGQVSSTARDLSSLKRQPAGPQTPQKTPPGRTQRDFSNLLLPIQNAAASSHPGLAFIPLAAVWPLEGSRAGVTGD